MKLGYQPPKSGPVRGVLLVDRAGGNDTVTVPMEIAAARRRGRGAGREPAPDSKPRAAVRRFPLCMLIAQSSAA